MVLLKPNSTTEPSRGLQKAFSGPTRSTRHLLCPRLCLQGQSDTVPGSVHPGLGVAFTAQLSLFPQFSTEGPETTHVQSVLCKREVKLPGEASASLGKPCDKMLPCRHTHTHTHPHRVFLISDSLPASPRRSGIPLLLPPRTLQWGSAVSRSGSAPPCVPASERSVSLPRLWSLGGKGFRNTREETSQSEGTDRLLKRVRRCERSK